MAGKKSATLDEVYELVRTYITKPESLELIEKAAEFARCAHEGQLRKSGEPYFIHPVNVAYILAELHVGPSTIAAGFLHDAIEDTEATKEEIAAKFNPEVAELVEAVTKIGNLKLVGQNLDDYQAANHRKIFIAMARDVRVILIKLADRLHNMRTLQYKKPESQKRIAQETLDVYAPIAHRLGISAIKNELEDLSFMYLQRDEYYRIARLVEAKKTERDAFIQSMIEHISAILEEHNIEFRIFGRSKHLYSIYRKMTKRHKRFEEILDLLAIRIVTKSELNCYEILGYIHAEYRPIPGRLKDYIAVPKANMYQSLHTTVIGDEGKIFEVQIRTEEMDEIAERGVAAHWRYKEGSNYNARAEQKEIEERLSWFRDFTSFTGESANASDTEYMETLQKDVFEANVYVMTPKGKVIDLPNGATPIDFAYRIHTDVGHTTVGAIVNDAMVPLNTELHTGDVVSIKTMKNTGPSEDWLKFVKTNQAKQKIRAFFARKEAEKKSERIPVGEKMLQDELQKRGFEPNEYMDKKHMEAIIGNFNVASVNDLLYNIAERHVNITNVCERLTNQKRPVSDEDIVKLINRHEKKRIPSKIGVYVPGIESMKMSMAQCCLPVYGDDIVGFVTKGEGVKVHRRDCVNMQSKKRTLDVYWEEEDITRMYDTNLLILSHDRNFLLTDILTCVSQSKAPMLSVHTEVNQETLTVTTRLKLQVRNLEHLQNVIANLHRVESIGEVIRESN